MRRGTQEWWDRQRHSPQYLARRDLFLERNPLCAYCKANGLTVEATDVDHIIAVRFGGDFWTLDNLQPLCRPCHEAKTAFEAQVAAVGLKRAAGP